MPRGLRVQSLWVPIGMTIALTACSDVRQRTDELGLTTDRSPHTVELWGETDPDGKLEYRYSLTFDQAYYMYQDNHCCLKQTTIGLLLDKQNLKPWTETVSAETGSTQPLDLENPALLQQRRRSSMVTIRGTRYSEPERRVIKPVGREYDIGNWHGFHSVSRDTGIKSMFHDVTGYSAAGPLVRVLCLDRGTNCTFYRYWNRSEISFILDRKDAGEAVQLSDRLVRLLQQHLVSRGSQP